MTDHPDIDSLCLPSISDENTRRAYLKQHLTINQTREYFGLDPLPKGARHTVPYCERADNLRGRRPEA